MAFPFGFISESFADIVDIRYWWIPFFSIRSKFHRFSQIRADFIQCFKAPCQVIAGQRVNFLPLMLSKWHYHLSPVSFAEHRNIFERRRFLSH